MLNTQIQRAVAHLFHSVKDITHQDVVFHHTGEMEYDPVSGGMIEVGAVDITLKDVAFGTTKAADVEGTPIVITDILLQIPFNNMQGYVARTDTDYVRIVSILDGTLVKHNIKWTRYDTAQALWTFFVREA